MNADSPKNAVAATRNSSAQRRAQVVDILSAALLEVLLGAEIPPPADEVQRPISTVDSEISGHVRPSE
jgi:hypothetical protein